MSRLLSCITACSSGINSGSLSRKKNKASVMEVAGLEVVLEKYQLEKNVFVQTVWEDDVIHLCNSDGIILKSISLHTAEWSACTLPGHPDCICLKYRDKGKSEVVLKGRSQDVIERVLMELDQSKAIGTSMGVIRKERDVVGELERTVAELREELGRERERTRGLERACREMQEEHASKQMCTPMQMKSCLSRIDELENRNASLDEDLRIQVRRTKAVSRQLEMVQVELERCEEEKAALVESLTQCHVQMSDMQHVASPSSSLKESLKGRMRLHSSFTL